MSINKLLRMKCLAIAVFLVALFSASIMMEASAQSKGGPTEQVSDCLHYKGVEVIEDYHLQDPADLLNYKLESYSNNYYYTPYNEGVDVRLNSEVSSGICYNRAMNEEARRSQHFQRRGIEGPGKAFKLSPKLHITIPLTEQQIKNNR